MRLEFGKYYIENDGLNWTIFEPRVTKEGTNIGTEYRHPHGYYTRLGGALNGLLNLKLHESEATTVQELQNDLRSAVEEITEVVRAYFTDPANQPRTTAPKVVAEHVVAPTTNTPVGPTDAYYLPRQALDLLPETEYELLELRRKGRGHTAVVKIHSPDRVVNILRKVSSQKGTEPAKVVVARRALGILGG